MRSQAPLLVTVTLNPALDLTMEVGGIVPGETTRVLTVRRDPAGKGINVSRAIQEFGGRTLACGLLGGHTGDLVERYLVEEGVPAAFNRIEDQTRENVIMRDRSGAADVRLSAPGPRVLPEELDRLKKRVCCLPEDPAAIVLSGSLPSDVGPDAYADIMHEARRRGIPTILDADGETLRASLGAGPLLIKPNRHEASMALDRELRTREDLLGAATELRDAGAERVALTGGAREVVFAGSQGVLVASPPDVEAVSPVGSGDAFLGVLALRLLEGLPEEEALRWAVAAGAATAATPGTMPAHRDQAEALLGEVAVAWVS